MFKKLWSILFLEKKEVEVREIVIDNMRFYALYVDGIKVRGEIFTSRLMAVFAGSKIGKVVN